MAAYELIGDAYDLVYPDTAERVPFVNNLLTKFGKQTVLDLGIGTGLFAIPLHQADFKVEGLEISEVMIDVLRLKAPYLKVHQGDIRHFGVDKRYEAILALSSVLVMVDNRQEISQCLQCAYEHLQPDGLLLLELPNHPIQLVHLVRRHQIAGWFKGRSGQLALERLEGRSPNLCARLCRSRPRPYLCTLASANLAA